MNRALLLLVALLILVSLASCQTTPKEIRIGINAELTGSIPVVGESCKNAANLAVKEINEAGGVEVGQAKVPVVISIDDNEDKAESAVVIAQKLASSGVLAMIGPNASRNAIPAAEVAESSRMPMISPWSTNPKLTVDARTGKPKTEVFRTAFTDDYQGAIVAKFALNHLKTRKPAVLYDVSSEANKGQAEVYKKTMDESGVKLAAFETYTSGDKDFSAQLTSIIRSGADSLFLPNYYSEVPLQIRQARQLGYQGQIVGSDAWGNEEMVKLTGEAAEGLFFTAHYAADTATPQAQAFIRAYQAAYGKTPDDVAALTYDTFGLLFQAIKTAGKLDREAVREALAGITDYEGVTGKMRFEGTGDPIKSAVVIRIKNGKFTFYQTAEA